MVECDVEKARQKNQADVVPKPEKGGRPKFKGELQW